METGLKRKVAVVTGAASGIGRAIAEALVDEGAYVAGLDLKPCEKAAFPILACDVASEAEISQAMDEAAKLLGRIDVLVNCAGIEIQASLAGLAINDLDRMLSVNIRGPILVTKAALPHLAKPARIINIASELAFLGRAGSSAYTATKGAIVSLTRSWARELAPEILVNAVAPGPIDTPLLDFAHMDSDLRALELSNPLRRIGQPSDVAAAVVFLASDAAGFMTGQCVGVDGGATMR